MICGAVENAGSNVKWDACYVTFYNANIMQHEMERQSLLSQPSHEPPVAEIPSVIHGTVYHSTREFSQDDEDDLETFLIGHDDNDEDEDEPISIRWASNTDAPPASTKDFRNNLASNLAEITGGFTTMGVQDFSKSTSTLLLSSALITLYLLCGVVGFTLFSSQGWTITDSLYFTVVTFTTTGYGDLVPVGVGERIFCIVFLLVGVSVLGGLVLGILFENLVEAFEQMKGGATGALDQEFMDKFQTTKKPKKLLQDTSNIKVNGGNGTGVGRIEKQMSFDSSVFVSKSGSDSDLDSQSQSDSFLSLARENGKNEEVGTSPSSETEQKPSQQGSFWLDMGRELRKTLPFYALILSAAMYLGYLEGWTVFASCYYAVVTATSGE